MLLFSYIYQYFLIQIRFIDLYANLSPLDIGYTKENAPYASPKDMEKYYTREEQDIYGVVAIKIRVLK